MFWHGLLSSCLCPFGQNGVICRDWCIDGELAGGGGCIVFADGGNPEKVFHMLILDGDECLVVILPGVECSPQWDGAEVCIQEEEGD